MNKEFADIPYFKVIEPLWKHFFVTGQNVFMVSSLWQLIIINSLSIRDMRGANLKSDMSSVVCNEPNFL